MLAASAMQARKRKEHCISGICRNRPFKKREKKEGLKADLRFQSSWRCRTRSAPSVNPSRHRCRFSGSGSFPATSQLAQHRAVAHG